MGPRPISRGGAALATVWFATIATTNCEQPAPEKREIVASGQLPDVTHRHSIGIRHASSTQQSFRASPLASQHKAKLSSIDASLMQNQPGVITIQLQRVVNTEYEFTSPVSTRASRRVWISNMRR